MTDEIRKRNPSCTTFLQTLDSDENGAGEQPDKPVSESPSEYS